MNFVRREPALVLGVIIAVINLVVGLGFLDATQGEAVLTVAESFVALIGAYAVRQSVTPIK